MAEEKAKRVKASAGTKVSCTVAGYVAGMETHPEFQGVSFKRDIPEAAKGDVKAINALRMGLIQDVCKQYDVKPLGATSVPSGGGKRDLDTLRSFVDGFALGQGKSAAEVIKAFASEKNLAILVKAFAAKGKVLAPAQVAEMLGKL